MHVISSTRMFLFSVTAYESSYKTSYTDVRTTHGLNLLFLKTFPKDTLSIMHKSYSYC